MREHWRAFDEAWFARHQRVLLFLLNCWVTAWLARWVLRIRSRDCSRGTAITEIAPNRFSYGDRLLDDGRVERTTDFRTHAKFSKRVYFSLAPLWWAFHAWDALVADRGNPELSFGFSTLTVSPDPDPETSTVDGAINRSVNPGVSWSTLRGGATGTAHDATGILIVGFFSSPSAPDTWALLYRSILLFDTSSLGAGASISAATLSLFEDGSADQLGVAPDSDIYTSTPAANTSLANADYAQLGTVSQTGSPIPWSGWVHNDWNDFPFNATGLGNISKTGISKFGWRNANYDVANVAPAWSLGAPSSSSTSGTTLVTVLEAKSADFGTDDPKLVVTYTTGAAPPSSYNALDLAGN